MSHVPQLVINYEYIEHGPEHPDYFQGCGVAFTKWDACFTGVGNSPLEAAHEALELASHDYKWNDAIFDEAEAEAETFAEIVEPLPDESDARYHVSIRIKTIT